MKIFAWILLSFSVLACFGILTETSPSLPGLAYGIAVSVFAGMYLGERQKREREEKLKA